MQSPPLANKVAIVTGASGGIGSRVARALLANGCRVTITSRSNQRLRKRKEVLESMGVPEEMMLSLAADLTEPDSGAAVVSATMEKFGGIDILINSAGIGIFKPFQDLELDEIQQVVGSNLMTTLHMTHHAIPHIMARKGHVVNIASGLGKRGNSKATAYSAAKFGVMGFTESLRLDMARHRVRVSAISPAGGGVDTDFWDLADPNAKRQSMMAPERIAEAVLIVLTTRGAALIDDLTVRTG